MNLTDETRNSALSFRNLFRMVLDDTGLKASTVALELQRERTLMYKWLSGSSIPPASHFPLIVEIVSKRTSEAKKLILETDLRALVGNAGLSDAIRNSLLAADSLESLLSECLELSVVPGLQDNGERAAWTDPRELWRTVFAALFAAVTGGLLWNALNRVLGWPYFMGDPEHTLRGFHALWWGLITAAPVPAPLLLQPRGKSRRKLVTAALMFTLVGGLSGLVFYSSGIREAVENLSFSYPLQEMIIVVLFAVILSVPPLIAAILALPRGRTVLQLTLVLVLPTTAAVIGFLMTLVIRRPVSEVLQLRGLVVAFALRLALFISLFAATRTLRANGTVNRR